MSVPTPTTAANVDGSTPKPPGFFKSLGNTLAEWRTYLGVAIFFTASTLILGIICLSYLPPKKEPLMFGLGIVSILLALGTFAALCYFVQRAKDQIYGEHPHDPTFIDVLITLGIAVLFGLSALAQLKELPMRCYSGDNEDFKVLGQGVCSVLTTMGAISCLGALTMLLTILFIILAIREADRVSKLPPPVFPGGAERSVMRWLDRNDPFGATRARDPRRQNSYGA
ncbi:hypothetical protein FA15DRAFT_674812 [Coprinopsis marcescibilis]|uniref:MARVEL domain-containing protein n=1 Tax=Coprinopsis marcescibilis TaxID=230819 RepID=A0A5C3KFZ0_COPMA|nr:hypothetical protein FA15DRAFT_674812 [Coprinopsis marcescibilis]